MRLVLSLLLLSASVVSAAGQSLPPLSTRLVEARARFDAHAVDEAGTLAASLHDDADAAGDRLVAAQALKLLASVRIEQERFADAQTALRRARDLFEEAGNRRYRLETDLLYARTLTYQGQTDTAVRLALPALTELERLALPREAMLAAYSQTLSVLRRDPPSEDIRRRALALLQPSDQFPVACSLWQSAGDDQFSAAEYAGAHELLTRALACYEALGRRSSAGRVLVSLGRVQRAHGQLHTAMDYYVRAAALQKADGDLPAWLQSVNAQAVTFDRLGQYPRAEALYRQALAVARREKLTRYEVFLQGNLGGSLLSAGRPAAALVELEAVLARETAAELLSVRHRQIAGAHADLGNLATALRHLDTSKQLVVSPTFDDRVNWLNQRAIVLAAQGRLEEAQHDLTEAVRLIEDARARVLSGDATRRGFGDLHQETFAASIDVAMRKGDTRAALELAEQARARALLDLVQARDSSASAAPPTVAEMQALARELDTTFLVYWVQPRATLAWIVTADSVHGERLQVGQRQLRQWVRSAAGSGDVPGAINAALLAGPDLRPWRALHRAIVAPLATRLPARTGSRITVVPHGPLLHLPFAGLLDARGRHLVERHTLLYAPSLAVLGAAARHRSPAALDRALVLGDPAPLPRLAGVQLPAPLPHAREEARGVARRFAGGAMLSVGGAATERLLRSQVADFKWLHVATHARVSEEATAPSYLLLARGNGDAADDGLLTAEEVKALPLDGATVVLSACGTALGRVTGEGTLGFTRAFLAAGARAVVATTWEMPDTAGLRTMQAFYAAALKGAGIAGALRTAQLQQLRALRAGHVTATVGTQVVTLPATPLLWAGYVAVGAP
jgi:CHAT domain-containing protein